MDKMLRFGPSTQLLSRCGNGWLTTGVAGVAPLGTANSVYQNMRRVSTTRPKKAQATKEPAKAVNDTVKEAVKKPKATIASAAKSRQAPTKTATASSLEKDSTVAKAVKPGPKTRTSKSASSAMVGEEKKATAPAKKATAPAKKATAPAKKAPATKANVATTTRAPKATAAASAIKAPGQATSSHTPTPTSTPRPTASNKKPATAPSPSAIQRPANGAPTPATRSSPASAPLPCAAHAQKPAEPAVDPSSPEYKRAARKWVATMIALPILLVTSYFLYDRLVIGHHPSLEAYRPKPQPAAVGSEDK